MEEEECYNKLRSINLFIPIVDFIDKELKDANLSLGVIGEDVVIDVRAGEITFYLCFWKSDLRFSLLIETNEIADYYFEKLEESIECVNSLRALFSNPVRIEYVKREKDRKLIRSAYSFHYSRSHKDSFVHALNLFNRKTFTEIKEAPAILG